MTEEIAAADTALTDRDVDDVLEESFPASDPPAWTPAIARPTPRPDGRTMVNRPPSPCGAASTAPAGATRGTPAATIPA
jgi:hypothetical protein